MKGDDAGGIGLLDRLLGWFGPQIGDADSAIQTQSFAGSRWVLRSSGAASGDVMNRIIARAASGSFELADQDDARQARHVQDW
jgi:hypothetical protein